MKELVLPSGRFASIRPITWWDKVLCHCDSTELMLILLACRVVTIDGEALTLGQAQEMELAEAMPLITVICADVLAGMKSKAVG